MRNLKRVLSLALATLMVMSMMVVGAGAVSFDELTDKDEIVNAEAVSVLNSLNIIIGKEDGSYDPTGIVTRAELCKMICVALNGGRDPQLGNVTDYTYKDTVGNWAAAYIEYCTNLGIVAGDGSGNFNPSNTVTGAEAAKMLLVAIGFSADIEKLVGPNWAINVNVLANDRKFFKGLETLNPSEGLTRDDAAQMIYNAIQAGMVKYEYNWVTDGATVTSKPQRVDDTEPLTGGTAEVRTILNYKYGVDTYQGVVLANEYASISGGIQKAGQIRYGVTMINDNAVSGTMTVKVDTSLDMLGKNVTLLIKDSKSNNVYTEVYGTAYVNDSNNIYTTTARKTNVTSFSKDVKADGVTNVSGADVYLNYQDQSTTVADFNDVMQETGNGFTVTVIDNDNDNDADLIMVVKPDIGVVSSYNEKGNGGDGAITVASKGILNPGVSERISNAEFADVVGIDELAKDDVVSYFKLDNDKYYVTKLESIEGKVQAVTGTQKLKMDGTVYTGSDLARVINEDNVNVDYHRGDDNLTGLKDAVSVGDNAKIYLDAAGYVAYIEAVEAPDNFVMLTNVEITGAVSGVKASAVFSDGTTSTITINAVSSDASGSTVKYSGAGPASDNLVNGAGNAFNSNTGITTGTQHTIYTYSKRDDTSYDLKTLSVAGYTSDSVTADNTITKGHSALPGVTGSADDQTVYVVKDGSNWSVYTGVKNVPTLRLTATAVTPVAVDDGSIAVVYVDSSSVVGDRKSVYVLDSKVTATQDEKGNDIYTVKALVDGEWTELEVDGANKNTTVTRGLYYDESSANNVAVVDNVIDLSDFTGAGGNNAYADPVAITGLKRGTVTVLTGDGTAAPAMQTLVINSDTKVFLIDGTEAEDIAVGSASDLIFDSTHVDSCSVAVAVRASADPASADYGVAGYIYIVL